MNRTFQSLVRRLRQTVLFPLALSALFLGAAPAFAAPSAVTEPASPQFASATLAPVLATFWTSFWHFLEYSIRSQQTMVQVGFVGMCLGLYIIIWKRRA
jgi:hypothetical protein